jgi:hypothetical protein
LPDGDAKADATLEKLDGGKDALFISLQEKKSFGRSKSIPSSERRVS